MKNGDKFLEWYRKRFNTIIEQPPNEVWNNISEELDINEVWTKVDSKLNHIDRRKVLVRRFVYMPLFLLLFLIPGSLILKTFNNKKDLAPISSNAGNFNDQSPSIKSNELQAFPSGNGGKGLNNQVILADKKYKRSPSGMVSSSINNEPNQQPKKAEKHLNNNGDEAVANSSRKNPSGSSFLQVKENIAPENSMGSPFNPAISFPINANDSNGKEEFLTAPMPYLLVSNISLDSLEPYFTTFALTQDSGFYSNKQAANHPFHGFYSGVTAVVNNTWLLNQLTFDGLKAKSLNQTNIDFGYAYGISAGYNFNNHFGGELNWYINSKEGQTYNFYDGGRYVTQKIRMDVSVVNMAVKFRNQGFNSFLNTPRSQNLLLGMNVGIFRRDRSSLTLGDNDNVIDPNAHIIPKFDDIRYSLAIGYEYEIFAFHKIIISSALLGNIGLSSIYKNNMPVPDGFYHTYSSAIGINFSAKYLIK